MTDNAPGYELSDRMVLATPAQVKAIGQPLRSAILQLLLERSATVSELSIATGRPKSTVAHHVKVLHETGLLRIVSTRKVRAIEERFYGRTARTFVLEKELGSLGAAWGDFNDFERAARESAPAFEEGKLWGFVRHARLTESQAAEFWDRIAKLVEEFDQLEATGDVTYGLTVGIYPTEAYLQLPESASPSD